MQPIPPTEQRVSVLRQGRRNVIKSCPDVFSRRRIRHVLKHDRMQKDRLYLKRYIHFLKPKKVLKSEFELFRKSEREHLDLLPTLCSHDVFGPQYAYFYVKLIDSQMYIFNTKWPFSKKKSYQWPHLCITTFPHSLWCRDACSVYNITMRKCRVSVNSLSRFVVRLQKGLTKQPQLFVFS